jgi:ubiquinone/menaquinone biosynthesis C-methylase UbiE
MKRYPETIEHDWHALYRDYPEVYDAFASFPYDPSPIDVIDCRFPLVGKVVVDVGSGSGRSTFALAQHAGRVIGVEPEAAMRALAERALVERRLENVSFVAGSAAAIPLPTAAADVVTAITASTDLAEGRRMLKPGGVIVRLDIAPDWYGGELNDVIGEPTPELAERSRLLVEEWGFASTDFDSVQEYGTTDNIVRTYGFIFGRKAIAHLRRTGQTSIRWRFRLHYRSKECPEPVFG